MDPQPDVPGRAHSDHRQAISFASFDVAVYAGVMVVVFNLVIRWLEEPHLRRERGPAYEDYCRRVPRWL